MSTLPGWEKLKEMNAKVSIYRKTDTGTYIFEVHVDGQFIGDGALTEAEAKSWLER